MTEGRLRISLEPHLSRIAQVDKPWRLWIIFGGELENFQGMDAYLVRSYVNNDEATTQTSTVYLSSRRFGVTYTFSERLWMELQGYVQLDSFWDRNSVEEAREIPTLDEMQDPFTGELPITIEVWKVDGWDVETGRPVVGKLVDTKTYKAILQCPHCRF